MVYYMHFCLLGCSSPFLKHPLQYWGVSWKWSRCRPCQQNGGPSFQESLRCRLSKSLVAHMIFQCQAALQVDPMNRTVGARLARPFTLWKQYDIRRQVLIKQQLQRIVDEKGISENLYEVASRSLWNIQGIVTADIKVRPDSQLGASCRWWWELHLSCQFYFILQSWVSGAMFLLARFYGPFPGPDNLVHRNQQIVV